MLSGGFAVQRWLGGASPLFPRQGRLGPVTRAQFVHYAGEVGLGGIHRNEEGARYFFVAFALADERDYLGFAVGQPVESCIGWTCIRGREVTCVRRVRARRTGKRSIVAIFGRHVSPLRTCLMVMSSTPIIEHQFAK